MQLRIHTVNEDIMVNVTSIDHASQTWCQVRDAGEYGNSILEEGSGDVLKDGELVARISYNGRAWDLHDNEIVVSLTADWPRC